MFPPVEVAKIAPEVAAKVFGDGDIKGELNCIRLSGILILDFLIKRDARGILVRATAKWVQTENYEIVGEVLAVARRRANITQVELARRLGKPQSFVSAFEAGKRRVDLVEFMVIVRALGADPVEIFAEIVRSVAG
jgi:DNA-binding transcriptional regulator YiaG